MWKRNSSGLRDGKSLQSCGDEEEFEAPRRGRSAHLPVLVAHIVCGIAWEPQALPIRYNSEAVLIARVALYDGGT